MLNSVALVGRLTKTPEIKAVGDSKVINFTVAVNRPFKNQDGEREADFISCQAWNKQAEFISEYLTKGQLVAIHGAIHTRTYEKEDSTLVYITEINVDQIQSLEARKLQTEEDIKDAWTKEWEKRSEGLTKSSKDALKKELAEKYQPMIDALPKEEVVESKGSTDLPF